MTGWLAPPDDDGIQWMKAMSKNGEPFRVGIKKAEHSIEGWGIEEESQVLVAQEASRVGIGEASQILRTGIPVNWPVGDTTWKLSESRVEDAVGISRYRLYPNHVYSTPYRLEFTNIRGRSFVFGDESGDLYSITTPFNGNHTLQYDSRLPNIRHAYTAKGKIGTQRKPAKTCIASRSYLRLTPFTIGPSISRECTRR